MQFMQPKVCSVDQHKGLFTRAHCIFVTRFKRYTDARLYRVEYVLGQTEMQIYSLIW